MRRLFFACLFLLWVAPVLAQAVTDCPAFVEEAVSAAGAICTELGRNQACYGNLMIDATPRTEAADFAFSTPGDFAELNTLDSLQPQALSLTDETWGIALLQLQANLPDTLPGQNVTMVVFGDVSVLNAVETLVEIPMNALGSVNVRSRPSTDASVITSLTSGQDVIANARLDDGSWARIELALEGDSRNYGWVSAQFLDGDINSLPSVQSTAPLLTPMQAFYFISSVGEQSCAQAPSDGILVQSPQGAGRVQFTANGVEFEIGSTVYLTAANQVMTVSVIEGSATVTATGVTQTIPAGTFTTIPLDANGQAPTSAPAFPQPYNDATLQTLPLLLLPQQIAVAPPLQAEVVQEAVEEAQVDALLAAGEFTLQEGTYTEVRTLASGTFTFGGRVVSEMVPGVSFFYSAGDTLGNTFSSTFIHTAPNVYSGFNGATTITFTSATTFTIVEGTPGNPGYYTSIVTLNP
jgi:hypothetical protein